MFYCSQTSKGERQVLHNPPFVTASWIKKSIGEPIECTVKFKVCYTITLYLPYSSKTFPPPPPPPPPPCVKEGVVSSPLQFVHTFQLNDSPAMEERGVQLEMVRRERHSSGQLSSGSITTPNDLSRTMSPTLSTHRLSGTWLM